MAEFCELFEVVIQLGAILAVVILMRERLFPSFSNGFSNHVATFRLWGKLALASVPAALIGILGDWLLETVSGKDMDGWLYHAWVVAIALIVYGIAFLWIERYQKRAERLCYLENISCLDALLVGVFQALSLVPGTSRSGSTVLGARLLGFSRKTAAEFSFLMAVPVMLGASAVKILGFASYLAESGKMLPVDGWTVLLIGCVTAFAVSWVTVRFLMEFVKKHSFAPFGVYRIVLGVVVLICWLLGI